MPVRTMLWENRTTNIGDATVDGYATQDTRDFFQAFMAQGDGVYFGYGNELRPLLFNPDTNEDWPDFVLSVETGAAVADGIFAISDARELITLPTPTLTTAFIIVATVYDQDALNSGLETTVRIGYVMATDGVTTPPTPTQTRGTRWDVVLASGTVNGGGNIQNFRDHRRLVGNSPTIKAVQQNAITNVANPSFYLPQNYDELFVDMWIQSTAFVDRQLRLRINDDNWNSYYTNLRLTYQHSNTVLTSWQANNFAEIELFGVNGNNVNYFSRLTLQLPNYRSGQKKLGFVRYFTDLDTTAASPNLSQSVFSWNRPDSISKLSILGANNASITITRGHIRIYGINYSANGSPLNSPIGYWS